MEIAATVLALFLAFAMLASSIGKLTRAAPVVESLDRANVPHSMYPALATVQLVGALGLVVGLWMTWAGVAAGIGFALYFAGAVGAHTRAGDPKGAGPAAFLCVVAALAAITRAAA